jgi:hypothetical protein
MISPFLHGLQYFGIGLMACALIVIVSACVRLGWDWAGGE